LTSFEYKYPSTNILFIDSLACLEENVLDSLGFPVTLYEKLPEIWNQV
jgi:hypothetical protein